MTQPTPTFKKSSPSPLAVVLILSAAFFVIFLVVSGAFFLGRGAGGGVSAKRGGISSPLFGGGQVGVIELSGVIMDSKKTIKRIDQFEEDPDVKAIVLRINSPGGAVAPSQEIYDAIRKAKKPVVASMSSVAASGGYYVACGTRKIFANPGTITGSIGVIMEFVNLEKLYDWAKIKRYAVKTGKFKDAGAEYRELTPEERGLLQGMVDDVLGQFKQAVSEGRKLPLERVTALADGRIFSGSQAKAAHLVDELGGLQEAIDEAARMAKIKGKPTVVYPRPPARKFLEMLMDEGGSKDDSSESDVDGAQSLVGFASRLLGGGLSAVGGANHAGVLPGISAPGLYWLWQGP